MQIALTRPLSRRRQPPDDDHVLEVGQFGARDALKLGKQRRADDQHAGARIVEDVAILGGLPQRVDRNRHRADLDRAEEAAGEVRRIEQQQRDPLFPPHAEMVAQRAAGAVDALQQLLKRDALVAALDGDLRAAAFADVAIDKMRGDVEDVGEGHRTAPADRSWSISLSLNPTL